MWCEWLIFVSGGLTGYFLKWLIDTAVCRSCKEAIRYREDLMKGVEMCQNQNKSA
jgi:hypothetical protein